MSNNNNNNNNNHVLLPVDPDTNHILSLRPTMIIDSVIMYLGGNDDTEILDPRLEEQIVKVYKKNNTNKVYAFVSQSHTCGRDVEMNGTSLVRGMRRELHEGDIISIYNADEIEYRYRFAKEHNIFNHNNNTNHHHHHHQAAVANGAAVGAAAAAAAGTATASTVVPKQEADVAPAAAPPAPEGLPHTISSSSAAAGEGKASADDTTTTTTTVAAPPFPPQLGENITCAVCMEILLYPRTMVPCGHSFCKDCGSQQTHCAQCRSHIESQITCCSLQNLVEHMVDISTKTHYGILEQDDLDHYHKRKEAMDASSARVAARAAARKKRRVMTRSGTPGSTDSPIMLS